MCSLFFFLSFYFCINSGVPPVLRRCIWFYGYFFLSISCRNSPFKEAHETPHSLSFCRTVSCLSYQKIRTHEGFGDWFLDLAADLPLFCSAAWAQGAHEPWYAVHYLFTADSYTGPWDSGLQLSASRRFGLAGCERERAIFYFFFNVLSVPFYI